MRGRPGEDSFRGREGASAPRAVTGPAARCPPSGPSVTILTAPGWGRSGFAVFVRKVM